ncbi:MAG: energy transducer TonB [Pseudomonadota bacterium]
MESDLPESLVERIYIPNTETPNVPGLNISDWTRNNPLATQDQCQAITKTSYLEIVRLKIESLKKYPKAARVMQIEGRVTISFIILPIGKAESIKVVKSSRFEILDKAALKAVKDASPFPEPPVRLFGGKIPLKITIVFDLT